MKKSKKIIAILIITLLLASLFGNRFTSMNVEAFTNEANVFADDFENGDAYGWTNVAGNWEVYDDTANNRVYRQSTSTSGFLGLSVAGNPDWEDYRITVDIKPEDISIGGAMLYFRYTDSNNHYFIYINTTSVTLVKKVSGTQTSIASATAAISNGTTYSFEVIADGQQITCKLNGVQKINSNDTTFTKGKIGLGTWVSKAKFDNILVYKTKQSYYVDDTSGNDTANDGHSSAYPWKTLYKLSQTTFDPGDSIYLKAGEDWSESIQLKGSGSKNDPIIMTSYGTGNKPKIIGPSVYNDAVLYFSNVSGWHVKNLEISLNTTALLNDTGYADRGILFSFTEPTTFSNIVIDNNTVHGNSMNSDTEGILISAGYASGKNDEVVSDITISNNYVYDIGWQAIGTATYLTSGSENISSSQIFNNVRILNNTVYNTANQGIILSNSTKSKILWNKVLAGGQYTGTDANYGPGAIWPMCSSYVDVMFNETAYMSDSNSGCDGTGIDIDWSCEFINVQYNYSHDNIGNGITTMSNINCSIINNKVSGNYAAKNGGPGQITTSDFTVDGDILSGVKNLRIADNVIIVNRSNTVGINTKKHTAGDAWSGNNFSGNRIILSAGYTNTGVYNIDTNTIIDSIDTSRIYSQSGSAFSASKYGVSYATFSSWKSATGHDTNSVLYTLDTTAPTTPSGISTSVNSSPYQVNLSWSASSDGGSGISHYNIYRSKISGFTPEYVNMVGESTTASSSDSLLLDSNATYYYKITAEDNNGNESAAAASGSVTTGSVPSAGARIWQASKDFSSLIQGSTWYSQYHSGSTYTSITTFYPVWNVWRDGSSYLVIGKTEMSPDSREAVRTWVAPATGTITIGCSGSIYVRDNTSGADGVDIKILKNSATAVWPSDGSWHTVLYGSAHACDAVQTYVKKGDVIHFIVNSKSNQYCDTTIWDPNITYAP